MYYFARYGALPNLMWLFWPWAVCLFWNWHGLHRLIFVGRDHHARAVSHHWYAFLVHLTPAPSQKVIGLVFISHFAFAEMTLTPLAVSSLSLFFTSVNNSRDKLRSSYMVLRRVSNCISPSLPTQITFKPDLGPRCFPWSSTLYLFSGLERYTTKAAKV